MSVVSGVCGAHQDRIIHIANDGSLSEIPKQFGPANLQVTFSPSPTDGPTVSSFELTLGTHKTKLPVCVTGLLTTVRLSDIQATASWYHEPALLPYYLNLTFFDPGYKKGETYNSGFTLLFNLNTARLIQMEALIVRNNGKSIQSVPVDLMSRCSTSQLSEFKDVPK